MRGLIRTIDLPTGSLHLKVEEAAWPLDELCAFAARRNPRRGFLIVSKVLGRHIPVAPSVMRASVRDLAARIPDDLPGPVLVVGLAETAICLGQSLFEELARRPGWRGLFLPSTRQQVDHPLLCRFEEPHSHASAHLVYRPDADLAAFRTLVLVDDEISTGTTLVNLASALAQHLPGVERIIIATLTDWSAGSDWLRHMPRPASAVSLLRGSLGWDPAMIADDHKGFHAAAPRLGTLSPSRDYGRLGWAGAPLPLPRVEPRQEALRIICTGEFTYPPFLLAERLEQAGHHVLVQSTTRSPALPGAAIRHILTFADNYDTGVPNFLYNANPAEERETLICHETPAGSIDPGLIATLGARTVAF